MSLTLRLLNYGEPPPERLSVTFDERGGSIGRGPENDWSIPDSQKQISRVHAVIEYRGGAYFIIDKSANGIFRNDEPHALAANHPVAISDGDRLTLGNFTAVVSIDWAAAAMAAPQTPAASAADPTRAFVPRTEASQRGLGTGDDAPDSPNPFEPGFGPQPTPEAFAEPSVTAMPEIGGSAGGMPDILDLAGGGAGAGGFEREPGEAFAPAPEGLPNTQEQHTPAHREVFDPFKRADAASSAAPGQHVARETPGSRDAEMIPNLPTQWKVRADEPGHADPGLQSPPERGRPQAPQTEPETAAPDRVIPDSDWKVRDNWKERDDASSDDLERTVDTSLDLRADPSAESAAGVDGASRFAEAPMQPATVAHMPVPEIPGTIAEATRAEDRGERGEQGVSSTVADEEPGAARVSAAAARPSPARDIEAIRALFEGMGLADFAIDDELLPGVMETIGKVFREAVAGTRDVLMVRTRIRNEFRVQHTMLRPKENNPLKFSVTIEDALHKMVRPSSKGFLQPVDAMREAFKDLAGHEVATVTGMRAGLEDVLSRFEPAELEKRMEKDSLMGTLLPATRKARLWELFVDNYETIMREAEGDFEELFGREFAQAYEREMEQVRRASAAAREKSKD